MELRASKKHRMINKVHQKRYDRTMAFIQKHAPANSSLLDLGTENPFTPFLKDAGYKVQNTGGENLDIDYQKYIDTGADFLTAFEIFEHMLAPFNILREMKTDKLIASVPLKLWFAEAYWNEKDDWDKHYHEFEKKQFDFLLDKAGWKIKDSELWTSADWKQLGIRPILRQFTPRYYIVYCERK
ncbi:MAG: methyltransferase [Flavobacteriales bacterium]